jgi:hypothetical protein
MLRESLEKAQEELRKKGGCAILWHNRQTMFSWLKTYENAVVFAVYIVVYACSALAANASL